MNGKRTDAKPPDARPYDMDMIEDFVAQLYLELKAASGDADPAIVKDLARVRARRPGDTLLLSNQFAGKPPPLEQSQSWRETERRLRGSQLRRLSALSALFNEATRGPRRPNLITCAIVAHDQIPGGIAAMEQAIQLLDGASG